MAKNEVPRGPISGYVVENVKRLRADRRWSLAELSEQMSKAGRPMLGSGLHRLEQGNRRIDVDDVVALAVAFGVSPITLLLPPTGRGEVEITEAVSAEAATAWDWLRARAPLVIPEDDDGFAEVEFQRRALPFGIRSYPMRTSEQLEALQADLAEADPEQWPRRQLPTLPQFRAITRREGGRDGGEHPEAP
jgi:transcriptional regulator with XRE-family HTH domain